MRWTIVLLASCTTEPTPLDGPAAPLDGALAPPTLTATNTHKLAQLTGDFDRERNERTASLTGERAGVWGTDLGASFEHAGTTYLLFGDTVAIDPIQHVECGDAIATIDPAGMVIDFVAEGGEYRSPAIDGVALGCYEVPLDGISLDATGDAAGPIYVWFSTAGMTRSLLARSDDDARTFAFVHDLSAEHFVNVSVVRDGDTLYLFGSGRYRESAVYLARVPLAQIEDRSAYEFFAGRDALDGAEPGRDRWTADELVAAPLFGPSCVGELSAHRIGDTWLVLYNCDQPRGIQARIARAPAAAWSEQVTVFDPWRDGGYCHFMHAVEPACDAVSDPGREEEWGGEYGPYLIESLTEQREHGATIRFAMSTWNPYQTVLMESELGF